MKLAVLDIDRTMSDPTHRAHHLQGVDEILGPDGKKHWDLFLDPELMILDPVVPGALQGLRSLQSLGYDIVFLTGRNESLAGVTAEWLDKNLDMRHGENCTLLMRPIKDRRPGAVVKIDVLNYYLSTRADVDTYFDESLAIIAFDDEPDILSAYARNGILALRAPECWQYLHILEKE